MLKVIDEEKGSYIIQNEKKQKGFMEKLTLEQQIVYQCAPVLADIKLANLLITDISNLNDVKNLFFGSDIEVEELEMKTKKAMVYLYRRKELQEYLFSVQIQYFLRQNGYVCMSVEEFIRFLKKRYILYCENKIEFPHELGVFLGYPLDDVKGFIKNRGTNYILSGYWKVYNKEFYQDKLFSYYKEARILLWNLLKSGITLQQILEWE